MLGEVFLADLVEHLLDLGVDLVLVLIATVLEVFNPLLQTVVDLIRSCVAPLRN